jgi:hypothetical protein
MVAAAAYLSAGELITAEDACCTLLIMLGVGLVSVSNSTQVPTRRTSAPSDPSVAELEPGRMAPFKGAGPIII